MKRFMSIFNEVTDRLDEDKLRERYAGACIVAYGFTIASILRYGLKGHRERMSGSKQGLAGLIIGVVLALSCIERD